MLDELFNQLFAGKKKKSRRSSIRQPGPWSKEDIKYAKELGDAYGKMTSDALRQDKRGGKD